MNILQTNCTTYDYILYTQLAHIWAWLILIVIYYPIGCQHNTHIYMFDIIYHCQNTSPMQNLIITSLSFYRDTLSAEAFTHSMANLHHVFKPLSICTHFAFRSWYLAGQFQVIIALAFQDNHIIYYHMDSQ